MAKPIAHERIVSRTIAAADFMAKRLRLERVRHQETMEAMQ